MGSADSGTGVMFMVVEENLATTRTDAVEPGGRRPI